MRPHARQTDRRGRGVREQGDDYYGSLHGEGHNREGYDHLRESYHRDDAYRAPVVTHRPSYDANNEPSASRGHRDSWRTRDQEDIYGRHDGYQHQIPRDDHAYLDREREPEHWPARPEMDARYPHSHPDWYDPPYPSTSYVESSSHHRHPIPHETPPSSFAPWPAEETYPPDRLAVMADDRQLERPSPTRKRDFQQRKGQKHNKKFTSDSGWDRNRKRKGWEDAPVDNHTVVERKWEPAPSWKASNPDDEDRSQGFYRSSNDRYMNSKTLKRSGNNQKQKRDWRQEDDSLNKYGSHLPIVLPPIDKIISWTRRSHQTDASSRQSTSSNKAIKTPSRRKYQDSVSPSRSLSPAPSYRSRRSSRDRSRTRSISPQAKRRRRDYSPNDYQRSQTPSEKGYYTRHDIPPPRHDAEYAYSPRGSPARYPEPSAEWYGKSPASLHGRSPHGSRTSSWDPNEMPPGTWAADPTAPERGRSPSPRQTELLSGPTRQRTPSSPSSRSSARSESRSPSGRNRTVHRLPSTDPTLPAPLPPPPKPETTPTTGKKKKKKTKANGHNNNHQKTIPPTREIYPDPTMPPPSIIPQTHNTYSQDPSGDSHMAYSGPPASNPTFTNYTAPEITPANQHSLPPRFMPIKSVGFKPIAQASSSIKRFFPGDDEDVVPTPSPVPPAPPFVPAHHTPHPEPPIVPPKAASPAEQPKIIYERPNPPLRSSTPAPAAPEPMESIQPEPAPEPEVSVPVLEVLPKIPSPPAPVLASTTQEDTGSEIAQTAAINNEFYKIVSQVGEGTFGKVYKAQNTTTKVHVALKRIRMESERDGFPVTAMREIKLLQSLRHSNVVQLHEMMISHGMIYMVFEYMDHDLTGILSQNQFSFEDAHLKSLCHQMLSGLAYLHQKGVIHRDIKGSNILINNRGELKLADFGLARFYQKRRRSDYTNRVITLWYRPPELLLGATVYGPEVDMWSAGCIMLELFTKKPVFQGLDEIHQLDVIYKILGTPNPQRWAGMVELPWYELIKPKEAIPNNFRDLFKKWMSPAALDLAEQLLNYDPTLRVTAVQAMTAPYFTQEEPPASPPSGLATLEGEWHELETKRERAKKRRKPEIVAQ